MLQVPNNAMDADSAITLRFHAEDHLRGAGDGGALGDRSKYLHARWWREALI